MKKVLIAMFTIASLTAMAQEGPDRGPRDGKEQLTPEQMATLQTKKMTLALDLSSAQQKQIQEFHLENAKLRKEKMEVAKGDRKDLSAEERYARQNERLDHMIAQKEEMKKILNEEQFSKWEKEMSHRKNKGRKGHKGKREHRGKR
ncbi:MAG: hypothetical protein HKP53_09315 [Eudoraea sp.]|nr:hypothetical protein [Eudoraea sp.]